MPALTYLTEDGSWASIEGDDDSAFVPHIESDGALTPVLISDRALAKDEATAAYVRSFARAWAEYRAMVGQSPEERAGKMLKLAVMWGYEQRDRPPAIGESMRRRIRPPKK